jgi:dTDP-4-amino-4,6-dideoxygalactose transaminase
MMELAGAYGLAVVEDACQAHGARHDGKSLGSIGLAGTFSFYPTKNLGALGDGGMVVTRDDELAAKLKRLRNGGQSSRYRHDEIGFNSRLDAIQAAVLRVKLKYLESKNERRRELSRLYEEALEGSGVRPVAVRDRCTSARHLFVIGLEPRRPRGSPEGARHRNADPFPIPTHLSGRRASVKAGSCPNAEKACGEILSLPLYPTRLGRGRRPRRRRGPRH